MCRTSHGLCALARDGAQLVLIPLLALALNVPLLLLAAPRFLREPPLPPGVERLHLGIRLVHCSREGGERERQRDRERERERDRETDREHELCVKH